MTASAPATAGVPRGVPRGVVLAALAATAGVLPVFAGFSSSEPPLGAIASAGWPALGLVAAILIDRDPRSRVGWVLIPFAAVPAVLVVVGLLVQDAPDHWQRLSATSEAGSLLLVLLLLVAVGWGVGLPEDRMARRRLIWLLVWSSALVAALVAATTAGQPRAWAMVLALCLWAFAAVVLRLVTTESFRPVDEPVLDAAVPLFTLAVGAAVAVAVRGIAVRANTPMVELSAAFAAVIAAVLVLPAGLWVRGALLQKRYGLGALSSSDVVTVTADLNEDADPRQLLDKAAAMVKAATGHRDVRLILGAEPADPPDGWVEYPLDVGRHRVGMLLVQPRNPEGPEPHQERVVGRMLPTIALMTRAVDLAAQAEAARREVTRQRDLERSRILGELHDGVGPQLAGLSMAVQAGLRSSPDPLLESVAAGLADARSDLRRIVSGLTPAALEDTDLAQALADLARSFDSVAGRVTLEADLPAPPPPESAVAVYRSVAEGITNALRHGRADHVAVRVRGGADGGVRVDIRDDGAGGAITPGVGLTSLRRRAESLGGGLSITALRPCGVHLRVEVPGGAAT